MGSTLDSISAIGSRAALPQTVPDPLPSAPKGIPADPTAQRTLQRTRPGGTPGTAAQTMPTQNPCRATAPGMTPPGPAPFTNGTKRPPPLGPAPGTEGKILSRAPRIRIPGNWTPVDRTPRGETAVKGTDKAPASSSSAVFGSVAQQEAFKSVVHLTDGRGGSGVIVANKGNQYMLLTNQHCLTGKRVGDSVDLTLSDGTKVQGKVAALGNPKVDDGHDLAAITFTSTQKLTVAKIATTEPTVQQKTFSIGYPYSGASTQTTKPSDRVDPRTGAMVAEGVITANRRDGEGQISGEYGLVTTSRVIQGMSGGGMFDANTGELVAINGQSARPLVPPKVQDGKSFRQTVGENGVSVGIAAAEIGQFLRQNKAALPEFAEG